MNNGLDTESRGPGSSSPSSSNGEVTMDHCAVCLGDFHSASFDPGVGEEGRGGGILRWARIQSGGEVS